MRKIVYLAICVSFLFVGSLQAALPPLACVFSPDGTKIVTADFDGSTIWSGDTGAELLRLTEEGDGFAKFSPDGKKIVTAGAVWDVASEKKLYEFEEISPRFSPDGKKILASDWDSMRILDAESGKELQQWDGSFGDISADWKKIVTADFEEKTTRILDVSTGTVLQTLTHASPVKSAAFSPDGSKIVTASENGTVQVWNAATGARLQNLKHDEVYFAQFSPDGAWLIAVGEVPVPIRMYESYKRTTVRVWNADTGREIWQRTFDSAYSFDDTHAIRTGVSTLYFDDFSPDGTKIIMKGTYGPIRFWHIDSGRELPLAGLGRRIVRAADFSPDGKRIVTVSVDDRDRGSAPVVQIWSAETGRELQKLAGDTGAIFRIVFSPDGKKVAMCGYDEPPRVWHLDEAGVRPKASPTQAEKIQVTIDDVKLEITSVRLQDKKTITLNVGDLCHYIEDEKMSIPYRWVYSISDENVMSVFYDKNEYDAGRSSPGEGGDKGWRTVCFKAVSPGECMITVRYEDIRDEDYDIERIYTVRVGDDKRS